MFLATKESVLIQGTAEGISGAWVVDGRHVCGVVVARYDNDPYLHMLPINLVLQDIANTCQTSAAIPVPVPVPFSKPVSVFYPSFDNRIEAVDRCTKAANRSVDQERGLNLRFWLTKFKLLLLLGFGASLFSIATFLFGTSEGRGLGKVFIDLVCILLVGFLMFEKWANRNLGQLGRKRAATTTDIVALIVHILLALALVVTSVGFDHLQHRLTENLRRYGIG